MLAQTYRNDRLYHLMEQLDHKDLLFLLKNGLGKIEKRYEKYTREQLKDLISADIRHSCGHSFANFFRLKHEYPYKNILIEVANLLADEKDLKYTKDDIFSEEEIEKEIIRRFEYKSKEWWTKLSDAEKEQIAEKINNIIDAEIVNSVNRWTLIKYRITKEVMDSIVTKGIIIAMVAVSAGGVLGALGGSVLSQIGWRIVTRMTGVMGGVSLLTRGICGMSGIGALDLIGGLAAGIAVFVPSTIYFYADTNYKKIVPTIIMLLSKIHLNKAFIQ